MKKAALTVFICIVVLLLLNTFSGNSVKGIVEEGEPKVFSIYKV